jgi:hypothetical protein
MSRDESLASIGWELDDLSAQGALDFAAFQRLFLRALDVCGSDTDDLEMFLASAKEPRWRDWMLEELANHPQSRVA